MKTTQTGSDLSGAFHQRHCARTLTAAGKIPAQTLFLNHEGRLIVAPSITYGVWLDDRFIAL
jgi:hypothetical protein